MFLCAVRPLERRGEAAIVPVAGGDGKWRGAPPGRIGAAALESPRECTRPAPRHEARHRLARRSCQTCRARSAGGTRIGCAPPPAGGGRSRRRRGRMTRAGLFASFLKIGLLGFGGVMPLARRVLVEERAWLDDRAFGELLGICQVLPGPNVVNLAVIFGARWHGAAGSLVALTGILFVPVLVVLLLATFYASVAHTPVVRDAIAGASAAAAGLILGTAYRLIAGARLPVRGLAVGAATCVAAAALKLPLPWALAVAIPVSIALEWRSRR
jgi:chromate transporter